MVKIAFTAILLLLCVAILSAKPSRDRNRKSWRLVCYLGSWANYRKLDGKYVIEDIDPHLCTHLIYGFTKLQYDRMTVFDPYLDLKDQYGLDAYTRFNKLRTKNPELTTIIAIGGWNEGSEKYSTMARDPVRRRIFVNSVLEFLQKYDFDGLDFDWEYPASREGSRPDDKEYFVQVLKDLKEAFAPYGYVLTAAVSPGKNTIDGAYNIPKVAEYLDFVNLMTYDYHGTWDDYTGINAPLYERPGETPDQQLFNVNYSVNYWLSHGTPAHKLVMGMPLYGRCLRLADPSNNGLGAPVLGAGDPGPFTGEKGMIGFNELCLAHRQEPGQWKITFDQHHKAPYASKGSQWCGFDNQESIALKVDYLKSMGLGGGMVWSIDTDDFKGRCFGTPYPLLQTIHQKLAGHTVIPVTLPPPLNHTDFIVGSKCKGEGNFVIPGVCTGYNQCIMQQGILVLYPRQCAPGTSFDPNLRQCVHSALVVGCGQEATTSKHEEPSSQPPVVVPTTSAPDTPKDLDCKSVGTFPHPTDCRKFIRCQAVRDGFKINIFTCPSTLVFNPKSMTCDYSKNVAAGTCK